MRDHIDLRQIFGLEDILNKLDDMLNDFWAIRQEVQDFNKEAISQYEALNLPQLDEVASFIEKFKAVYPNIISKKG